MNTDLILKAYVDENWGGRSSFQGNFINFGYWEGINLDEIISVESRVMSGMKLYSLIFSGFTDIVDDARVLELGTGKGAGLINLAKKYHLINFYGVDIVKEHIKFLVDCVEKADVRNLYPFLMDINVLDFNEDFFDFIFSVEVAQHFTNVKSIFDRIIKVLKPKGFFSFAAHFCNDRYASEKIRNIIPYAKNGVDVLCPIQDINSSLALSGFCNIEIHRIGDKVFTGFQRWIEQNSDVFGSETICQAYEKRLIDYFLIRAQK